MAVAIVVAILLIDQIIKIEVKTNMTLGEAKRVTDWFYIEFIENNGMAYGMKFINKLVLSLFRLFAIGFIGYYLAKIIKKNVAPLGYIVLIAMVLAGAAGNLIDCLFYGLIFDASTPFTVSQFVPFGEGYSTFLHGKVVDMFYFPIIQTTWPEWVPYFGGSEYVFFSPVFNFADACISVGVVALLLFYRKQLEVLFSNK
ncbi:MAG: lipoprotein signal peptidase [Prevotella stercorea]|nr:lipoprotein signal peptidase [Leyella stercorea]MCI5988778.1 lipoprotein signal peptidase [Prevotella sp.]MCI6107005.1 lipoprotein signal peptidase [Prevotella sp.]MCI6131558.1 lipoprotein signal peptidase [Prevotella sp.]MCI6342685.1 lipoprotein signal peptidase [Prevotella sp.]MCI6687634.1 lipoprotein signal peptidase [Prevotella sp.]